MSGRLATTRKPASLREMIALAIADKLCLHKLRDKMNIPCDACVEDALIPAGIALKVVQENTV